VGEEGALQAGGASLEAEGVLSRRGEVAGEGFPRGEVPPGAEVSGVEVGFEGEEGVRDTAAFGFECRLVGGDGVTCRLFLQVNSSEDFVMFFCMER
jgi:hypothetical protein